MPTPFTVLELEESAGDAEVKKAYLVKVREHPPERDPQGFQKARSAFETIRTEKDRLRYQLFHYGQPDLELLDRKWLAAGEGSQISEKMFLAQLAAAIKSGRINKG